MVKEFEGDFYYLNMFYNCPITFEGKKYLNAFAAYQAAKCVDENDKRAFTRLNALKVKKRIKTIKVRDDWQDMKYDVMYKIQEAKFTQNEDLKKKLLSTDGLLVNNVSFNDTEYGVHYGKGSNKLGVILMELRDKLKMEERNKN